MLSYPDCPDCLNCFCNKCNENFYNGGECEACVSCLFGDELKYFCPNGRSELLVGVISPEREEENENKIR